MLRFRTELRLLNTFDLFDQDVKSRMLRGPSKKTWGFQIA